MGQNNRRAELKISLRVVDDDDDAPSSLSLFLRLEIYLVLTNERIETSSPNVQVSS